MLSNKETKLNEHVMFVVQARQEQHYTTNGVKHRRIPNDIHGVIIILYTCGYGRFIIELLQICG
jgi:hypothetical protein